jgi:hypothetical protein
MHVHDLGIGRVDLTFPEPAFQVEKRQILGLEIIERAGGG